MKSVSAIKLTNNGGFVCAPAVNWIDGDGNTQTSETGGHISLGQSEYFYPNNHGVPNQSPVELYIWIDAGNDRTGGIYFMFDESAEQHAVYDITGSTLNSKVNYDGIVAN